MSDGSLDWLDSLEPEVRKIIEYPGSSVVIACPGAGKTSILKYRYAYLISNGISPENIVLVTFSNRSANRLKREVIDLLKQLGYEGIMDSVQISTFHSLCVNLMRQSPKTFGLDDNFSIYDETDQQKLISIVIRYLQREWDATLDEKFVGAYIRKISELKTGKCLLPEDAYYDPEEDQLFPSVAEVYELYEMALKNSNATDFDGLLVNVYNAIDSPYFIGKFGNRFKHILVDEYQDFTLLQHILFLKLSKLSETFMVVGDPAQSIYSFRYANHKYLLDLANNVGDLVPKMIKAKPNVFYMNKTKRLSKETVQIANNLMAKSQETSYYEMEPVRTDIGSVVCYCFESPEEEFEFVAMDIESKVQNGASYSDIAVISRNRYLIEKFIPYLKVPYVKLFPEIHRNDRIQQGVDALISALKVIVNPKDNLSWHKIYEEYVSGRKHEDDIVLTPKELDKYFMGAILRGDGKPFVLDPEFTFNRTKFSTSQQILNFLAKWGIELVLNGQKTELLTTPKTIIQIIEDIAELINSPEESVEHVKKLINEVFNLHYSYYGDYPEFSEVVSALALSGGYLEELLKSGKKGKKIDRVHLLTIHGAKGLEFKHVYLIGMRDDVIPGQRVIDEGSIEGIEEERRVCFVGITRSKETLTLTLSKLSYYTDYLYYTGFEDCSGTISRFISDMEIPIQRYDGYDDPNITILPF